jgi:hypothetical protein
VVSFSTADATAGQVTLTPGGAVVDTTPPTVTLTSPASGATVSGILTISANASDQGTGVTRVQFFVDGALVGEDTTAPYAIAWNTSSKPNGTYPFSAIAFDGAGHGATSGNLNATISNSGPVSDTMPPAAPSNLRVR